MPDSIAIDPKSIQPIQSAVEIDPASIQKIGGGSSSTSTPAPKPGFLKSFGQTFGLDPDTMKAQGEEFKAHPIKGALESMPGVAPLEGLYHGFMRSTDELGKGVDAAREGNPSGLLSHAISSIPILGPAIDKAGEQAPPSRPGESFLGKVKDVATDPGAMGTVMGTAAQVAPLVLGGADAAAPGRGLVGEIPTRAKAGKLFQSISGDAANQPVQLTRTSPELQKLLQLGKEGGGNVPLPARQLANAGGTTSRSVPLLRQMQNELSGNAGEVAQPKPLLYPSARNFQSGLSSLSREDAGSMGGPMKGQLKQVNKALFGDIHDAATAAGRGEDFVKAMRDFRRAALMRDVLTTGAKWALPAVVGGGLVGKILNSGVPKK